MQTGKIERGGFAAALLVTGLLVAAFMYTRPAASCPTSITIASTTLCVLVAETETEIERGLGGRNALREHSGMLFTFQKDGMYSFWMKDMRFALDIVWIRADGTIVGIEHAVRPESYPKTFAPPEPIRMVLEVPTGAASDTWIGMQIERIRTQ